MPPWWQKWRLSVNMLAANAVVCIWFMCTAGKLHFASRILRGGCDLERSYCYFLLFNPFHTDLFKKKFPQNSSLKSATHFLLFLKHALHVCDLQHTHPHPSAFHSRVLVSPCIGPSGLCLVNCFKQRETLKSLSRKIILLSFVYCQSLGPERHSRRWGFGRRKGRWHRETQT